MKRSFLSRLHRNGIYYLIGSLCLLVIIPLYQLLLLVPQGYSDALAATGKNHESSYLYWVGQHLGLFTGYRLFLILGFALLLSLPFTLFRIIVAQEILGIEETTEEETASEEDKSAPESAELEEDESNGMPANAWRGKGFAVIAAWSGLLGIICYALGTIASTLLLSITGIQTTAPNTPLPESFSSLSSIFTIGTYTLGGGFLGLACLFFGAVIARRGSNLWPGIWVIFSYMALALAILLSVSAVTVASSPTEGQTNLTAPALLLFALWVLWFGIMLIRLKPEDEI